MTTATTVQLQELQAEAEELLEASNEAEEAYQEAKKAHQGKMREIGDAYHAAANDSDDTENETSVPTVTRKRGRPKKKTSAKSTLSAKKNAPKKKRATTKKSSLGNGKKENWNFKGKCSSLQQAIHHAIWRETKEFEAFGFEIPDDEYGGILTREVREIVRKERLWAPKTPGADPNTQFSQNLNKMKGAGYIAQNPSTKRWFTADMEFPNSYEPEEE